MFHEDLQRLTFYRGRVALFAILKALRIGDGDEVATQAFTCVAVPEAIIVSGAKPRFIDIESGGINLDINDLRTKWHDGIRAIIVQHTFGVPADMGPIQEFAISKNVPLIEDCCHTVRSEYDGRTVGGFGIAAFYSFEWGKPLVAGIGGAAVVNDEALRASLTKDAELLENPSRKQQMRLALQYRAYQLLYRPSLYWSVRTVFHALSGLGLAAGNYQASYDADLASPEYGWRMSPPFLRRLKSVCSRIDQRTASQRDICELLKQRTG